MDLRHISFEFIPIPDSNVCFENVSFESTFLEQFGNTSWILIINSHHVPSLLSFRFQITINVLKMFLQNPSSCYNCESYLEISLIIDSHHLTYLLLFPFQITISVLECFPLEFTFLELLGNNVVCFVLVHYCTQYDYLSHRPPLLIMTTLSSGAGRYKDIIFYQ